MDRVIYLIHRINDPGILTAFSDLADANKFVDRNPGFESVPTRIDDDLFGHARTTLCFVCIISLKSGAITGFPKHMTIGWEGSGVVYRRLHAKNSQRPDRVVIVSTQSDNHARKWAAQAREKFHEKGNKWDSADNLNQIVEFVFEDGVFGRVASVNLESEYMSNTLGYGLRHTCEGMVVVVSNTTFGQVDESEELPIEEARSLMRELRQLHGKVEKTI